MKSLLQKIFENEVNDSNYRDLILNLFNSFDFSKEHTLKHQFNDAERQALNDFTYFGTYEDAEKKCLDVLTVELKSSSKVERARSLQRNLIGKYLKTNLKDSALVAFYSKDNPDWRLSFVKIDYRLDKMGVKVEIGTPPKRCSFLVGKTEPSHTAQKQLLPLLDDRKVPTLDEIEKSFSIEKVTKEFYTEIAKKFTELVGGERKIGSKKIVEAGQLKYPKPSDTLRKEFAVRLIGRLMFCWFLKKKKSEGGVPLIPNVLLSSDAISQYSDYYHSLLEPLFFQVLNTPIEKRNKSVRHSFWNNVPFLNGGLFEPHLYDYYEIYYESGLSKYINTLKVPDSWFLDLFKIFEIYNFTIDESTSIDIDISVDPEMLGRIFENLLAEINPETGETARKSTGSYYTPRPIVEYMVDESLKQYLKTQLTTSENVIPTKVGIQTSARHSEQVSRSPEQSEGEESLDSRLHGNDDIDDKLSRLLSYGDWEIELTETEKDSIIDALDRAKIIDPACGSGAFPMGILHKMLLILQKIDPESKQWLSKKLARIDNEILRKELEKKLKTENWDYIHKLGIIQNSIYGVDIQPIAVEISKLRFFLSLIVDEKIDDDKPNRGVVPLPNLEFKFVAANSLIGLPLTSSLSQMELFEARDYINRLKELRDAYFTSYGEEKNKIEQEFQEIQNKMFEYAHKEMVTHKKTLETQTLKLAQWNPFSDEASSWFDPEWMFGVKDGFDIVIANPPYVRVHKQDYYQKSVLRNSYKSPYKDFDIYIVFIERGLQLLKANGILSFITPDKYLIREYGEKIRQIILQYYVLEFYDISRAIDAFSAAVYPLISLIQKSQRYGKTKIRFARSIKNIQNAYSEYEYPQENWLKSNLIELIEAPDLKLLEKFYNGSKQLHNIIEKENIFCGTPRAKDYYEWSKGLVGKKTSKRPRVLVCSNLAPYVIDHGKEVRTLGKRIKCPFFDNSGSLISDNLWSSFLFIPKILIRGNDTRITAAIDYESSVFIGIYGIKLPSKTNKYLKFLTALLNSALYQWIFFKKNPSLRIGGEYFSVNAPQILSLPFREPDDAFLSKIDQVVDKVISAKQKDPNADTSALERQIDKMVYELYELTPEEIEIVEGFNT